MMIFVEVQVVCGMMGSGSDLSPWTPPSTNESQENNVAQVLNSFASFSSWRNLEQLHYNLRFQMLKEEGEKEERGGGSPSLSRFLSVGITANQTWGRKHRNAMEESNICSCSPRGAKCIWLGTLRLECSKRFTRAAENWSSGGKVPPIADAAPVGRCKHSLSAFISCPLHVTRS